MVEKGEKSGDPEVTTPLNPQPVEDIENFDEENDKILCFRKRGKWFCGMVAVCVTLILILLILILYGSLRGALSGPQLRVLPAFRPGWFYDDNQLIHYRANDEWTSEPYVDQINDFLKYYSKAVHPHPEKIQNCSTYIHPHPDQVCDVHLDIEHMYPCVARLKYNYYNHNQNLGGPCMFLYLDHTYDWTPQYFSFLDASHSMPLHMPHYLKNEIIEFTRNDDRVRLIWVTCEGEEPADKEHMQAIRFMPIKGFPASYFPYNYRQWSNGYLNPVVAINFESIKRGVIVNIVCKAWAKNINKYDPEQGYVSTTFSVLVD